MDGFIKHMKRRIFFCNLWVAFYTMCATADIIWGLAIGIPVGVLVWLVSGYMAWQVNVSAHESKMASKILDQAQLQKQQWEEEHHGLRDK